MLHILTVLLLHIQVLGGLHLKWDICQNFLYLQLLWATIRSAITHNKQTSIFYVSHLTLTTTQIPMKPLQSWIETECHWKWQKTEISIIYILFFSLRNIPCQRNHLMQKENEKERRYFLTENFKTGKVKFTIWSGWLICKSLLLAISICVSSQ